MRQSDCVYFKTAKRSNRAGKLVITQMGGNGNDAVFTLYRRAKMFQAAYPDIFLEKTIAKPGITEKINQIIGKINKYFSRAILLSLFCLLL
jgi:hypothetical protein